MDKALTPSEYREYIDLKNTTINLKAQRSDLLDTLYEIKKRTTFLENEYDKLQDEIDQKTDEFNIMLEQVAEKYNLDQGVYNFADTEPHSITLVN
jgi:predicted nuclease with TOPRIM domain